MRVLSLISKISKAVDTGNPDLVYQALSNPDCHVSVSIITLIFTGGFGDLARLKGSVHCEVVKNCHFLGFIFY